MKVLFLGGVFPDNEINDIVKNSTKQVQFAADVFQKNLICGLQSALKEDFSVLSAPFINPYPNGYSKIYYRAKKSEEGDQTDYVSFCNIWGFRNVSRSYHLKKAVYDFIKIKDPEKYIITYSPHIPLLKAALYAQKKDNRIKTILLLPDLPQFVTQTDDVSLLYKVLKPFDIRNFYKLSFRFDSYIYLTKYMDNLVGNSNKKYLVVEGISSANKFPKTCGGNSHTVVYTGTLLEKYGICTLVDAFRATTDRKLKLIIAGEGDSVDYIKRAAASDSRIQFLGQISHDECIKLIGNASILVNPRQNTDEFTRFSFPSKNMEYLSSGIPVIAYKLDGIPDEYDDVLFYPENNTIEALASKIVEVSQFDDHYRTEYSTKVSNFLSAKNDTITAQKIIAFIKEI